MLDREYSLNSARFMGGAMEGTQDIFSEQIYSQLWQGNVRLKGGAMEGTQDIFSEQIILNSGREMSDSREGRWKARAHRKSRAELSMRAALHPQPRRCFK